jgi:DNA-binding transcriptional MerR regulator
MQSRELVKLYYRIGEVSEIVGVQPHVLRYWETEFRSIRPQKSSKGQRVYSRRDVEKLLKVKDLLRNQGFTIAGARKRLNESQIFAPSSHRSDPEQPLALAGELPDARNGSAPSARLAESGGEEETQLGARDAGGFPVVGARAAEAGGMDVDRASAHPDGEEAAPEADWAGQRPASQRGAKDMRKALLALRRELLGMLDDLSALRRP